MAEYLKGTSTIRLTTTIRIKEQVRAHMETEEEDLVVEVAEATTLGLSVRSSLDKGKSSHNNGNIAYIATSETVNDPGWYADSGASCHVTDNVGNLGQKAYS
ncbi:hypothetical protein Dimus_009841 [Dionaea muscipula]